MLLRWCLICISIIILKHFLHLLYLLSMPRSRSIFVVSMWSIFHFIFIFIRIKRTISWIPTYLFFFFFFLEYVPIFLDDKLDEERKTLSSSKNPASKACLAFASFFANFSLDLLIKVLLIKKKYYEYIPISIYLSKVNNKNSRTICKICSKLKMKTPEQRYWRCSGVFIVNFEQISHIVLLFPSLALNK